MSMNSNPSTSQNVPASEDFGTVRNDAESFGNLPHVSEAFGKVPQGSERSENHTLTVKEVARMFESAGVARTERSIVNWCQPNPQGVARLEAHFDMNDRKWFITPQSVERVIAEEKAKAQKTNPPVSEAFGNVPKGAESRLETETEPTSNDTGRVKELEKEVMDLKITNRGKDYFIEQLQKEREGLINQVVSVSRKVGELETKLLQLEGATEGQARAANDGH